MRSVTQGVWPLFAPADVVKTPCTWIRRPCRSAVCDRRSA